MRKTFSLATVILLSSSIYAQTCVGTFTFKFFDEKSKKPLKEKMEKSIWYVFTEDESSFYDNTGPLISLDSAMTNSESYKIKQNGPGYSFMKYPEQSTVAFPALCGLYLVQMEFIRKKDTMNIGIYNIPAHQSFQIDTVMFKKGNYILDLQASNRLSEFNFLDDKGYFLIPSSAILPFPKKEEKQ